jgi:uncharacterized protein YpmS
MAVSRRVRLFLILSGILAAILVVALLSLYVAVCYEPAFYFDALEVDDALLEKGSNRMLQQTVALTGAVKKEGDWEALFTAEQINGWLAVDMVENHPKLLPPYLYDPRVMIQPRGITVACRYEHDGLNTVLSLTFEPYMPEPNVIAMRFVNARAGLLPIPLGNVLERFTEAAHDMQWHVTWRHAGSDPVAMLSFPFDDDKRTMQMKTIRLGDGEIYVAGSTVAKKPPEKSPVKP